MNVLYMNVYFCAKLYFIFELTNKNNKNVHS